MSLPTFANDALKRHQQAEQADRRLVGSRWVNTGLMFTSTIGTPLDERNVRRSFKTLLSSAELLEMRLHDLRHSTTTLLLGQGVHPRVVMETLGHSQVSLTLDTYSHVLPGLQAEAAKRMEDAIGCQIGCQGDDEAPPEGEEAEDSFKKMVSLTFASWNQIGEWFSRLEALRQVALAHDPPRQRHSLLRGRWHGGGRLPTAS